MAKFIDLFAGIGGFRIALESLGHECVFSSEIDTKACETYEMNFGERPKGDIRNIRSEDIPDHDIITAGFPCQPFSNAGKRKGFLDTRGTLIHEVFRIAGHHKTPTIMLENVKGLVHHDGGKTLATILGKLRGMGYHVSWDVVSSKDYGLPQNRQRLIILADRYHEMPVMKPSFVNDPVLKHWLDKEGDFEWVDYVKVPLDIRKRQKSGLIFAGYLDKGKWNGSGNPLFSRTHRVPNRVYSSEGVSPTIASQDPSGRYWVEIGDRARKLTLTECYRIMGFPDWYRHHPTKGCAYRQVGNSVSIHMIKYIFAHAYRERAEIQG